MAAVGALFSLRSCQNGGQSPNTGQLGRENAGEGGGSRMRCPS